MDHSKDGMRYPSIDELIDKTNSKYVLVVGAAKRARQIEQEHKYLVKDPYNKKSIGIALEEIAEDKVKIFDIEKQNL